MNTKYKCPICGNTEINSIGIRNGHYYCRKCISFKTSEHIKNDAYPKRANIFLEYSLSDEQKKLSDQIIENYKRGIDTLVYAVCGSGKTEISLGIIQYAIQCGEKVAFAVPRRDVVIELYNRLKTIFRFNKVVAVYGGNTSVVNGDLIVLTTHQLYRYKKFFSLIILDEIDAFPFKNNEILKQMFFNALDGHYVLMSATPNKDVLELFKGKDKSILRLDTRFHRHPLPVPEFKTNRVFTLVILLKSLRQFLVNRKPVFVFCPTINECENVYRFLKLFYPHGNYVHSKCIDRNERINNFRNGTFDYLVTTSVLERGVTVKNLQVIVFDSDNKIYDSGVLIQIAGRVGRKIDAPDGQVIFISKKVTKEMTDAIEKIRESNKVLQDMLQEN